MTPKEKANQLVDEFLRISWIKSSALNEKFLHSGKIRRQQVNLTKIAAIKCALILVNELLIATQGAEYYQEVKKEIQQL